MRPPSVPRLPSWPAPRILAACLALSTACANHLDEPPGAAPRDPAAPPWAHGSDAALPQPADVEALYRAAAGAVVQATGWSGLLVCEVSATGRRWDDHSGVDLGVRVRLPGRAPVDLRGHDDWSVVDLALPDTTLAIHDTVGFELRDRDLASDDSIAHLSAPWDGDLPWRLEAPEARIDCRAVDADVLRPHLDAASAELTTRLASLQASPAPDRTRPDWGYPVEAAEAVKQQITAIAGLVGWSGPAAREGVAAFAAFDTRWAAVTTPEVSALVRTLPTPATPVPVANGAVHAQVSAFACVPSDTPPGTKLHPDASVTLHFANGGPTPIALSQGVLGDFGGAAFVTAEGRDVPGVLVSVDGRATTLEDVHLAPEGSAEVVLVGETDGRCPVAVRLAAPENTWLRLSP